MDDKNNKQTNKQRDKRHMHTISPGTSAATIRCTDWISLTPLVQVNISRPRRRAVPHRANLGAAYVRTVTLSTGEGTARYEQTTEGNDKKTYKNPCIDRLSCECVCVCVCVCVLVVREVSHGSC
uniref:Uncharacterized protein n=1 Tax=Anguilla anguilla TaxID=7936 RepID=A0A0E9XDG0_ANGAN